MTWRLLVLALALAACQQAVDNSPAKPVGSGSGGSAHADPADATAMTDPADDPPATPDEIAADFPPGFDFDKAAYDAKVRFMKRKVLPVMRAAFQQFDKDKYASFGCKTCHGKNALARKYKMPNPELPQLDFSLIEQGKQKPEMVNFMSKVVKPQIAKIFDRPPGWAFQPGHGCVECHTEKK